MGCPRNTVVSALCWLIAALVLLATIAILAWSYHVDVSNHHRTTCVITRCNITTRYCGRGLSPYTCVYIDVDFHFDEYVFQNYTRKIKTVGSELIANPPTCEQMLNIRDGGIHCWYDERRVKSSLKLYRSEEGVGQIVGMALCSASIVAITIVCLLCWFMIATEGVMVPSWAAIPKPPPTRRE